MSVSPELLTDLLSALREMVREMVREELAAAERDRPAQEWMTVAAAADALQLSPAAVRQRVKRGTLEGRTEGRRVLVSVASVRKAGGRVL